MTCSLLDRVRVLGFASLLALPLACGPGSGGSSDGDGGSGDDGSDDGADGDGDDDGADDGGTATGGTDGGTGDGGTDTGGATTGGTDGGGETVQCEKDGDADGTQIDPDHRQTTEGDNGSFTDECDEDGNLIEYTCEVEMECGPPPNPECTSHQTGNVVPTTFDCDGQCKDGACVARCPDFGDELEYLEVGDPVVFENLEDGRRYACTLTFDQSSDTYDCANDPMVGDRTVVFSLGLSGNWCTGGEFGNIGTGDPQQCTYRCSIAP